MHQDTAGHSSFENLLGCLFTKFNMSMLFFNLDRYCFKHIVTYCLLPIGYLGKLSRRNSAFLRQESGKVHRGILAPAGVICSLFWASFSQKLLCTGFSLCFSMQKGFCGAAQPGLVSTFLAILSTHASFCQITVT